MGKFKNMVSRSVKKGDLGKKLFCSFIMAAGYSNMSLQALEIRHKKFVQIKKKYSKFLNKTDYPAPQYEGREKNRNIWICWFQGLENAPEIVKRCVNSVYEHMHGYNITLITQENLFDYVTLPKFIIDKWKKGIISNTHLSDIVRTELLIKYGGLWMDATTYLTAPVPEYIFNSKFFLFRNGSKNDVTITYNSWFIYSEQDNRVLKTVRDLLYKYWEKSKKLKEYFLWHVFVTMVYQKWQDDFKNMPYIMDEITLHLSRNILFEFNKEHFEAIKQITPIHKLSYKYNLPEDIKCTYYDYILNHTQKDGN